MTEYNMAASGVKWRRGKFSIFLIIFQVIFVVIFALLVEYGPSAQPKQHERRRNANYTDVDERDEVAHFYPMFQDVHVMMFIGFGYLMTFLKRYGFSSVGFTLLVGAIVIQWATLMSGFLHLQDGKIQITIETMLTSDFACAAVLISFGALLGKTSPIQLIVLSFLEIIVFQLNEWIGLKYFQAVDVGGSMFVHVFGAYFGITVARVLYKSNLESPTIANKNESVYHSDLFAMIGTVFLWLFWPSFNSAVAAPGDAQHRAVLNTYYALCACTLVTFALSNALDREDKFDMVHIENATLAGGVAVGTFADMDIGAWGAMVTGMVAATVSVLGYKFLSPFLNKFKLTDTCGVNNLHGMPGLIGGLGGIVVAYMADEQRYGPSLYSLFPGRAPENRTVIADDPQRYGDVDPGDGWSAAHQAGMQAATLGVTLAMAIVGGIITGFVLKLPIWNMPKDEAAFEDTEFFLLPEEGYPHVYVDGKQVPNDADEFNGDKHNTDRDTQNTI